MTANVNVTVNAGNNARREVLFSEKRRTIRETKAAVYEVTLAEWSSDDSKTDRLYVLLTYLSLSGSTKEAGRSLVSVVSRSAAVRRAVAIADRLKAQYDKELEGSEGEKEFE